jgi:hypothetical protein
VIPTILCIYAALIETKKKREQCAKVQIKGDHPRSKTCLLYGFIDSL